jgi:hypothetical protein
MPVAEILAQTHIYGTGPHIYVAEVLITEKI